MIGAALLAVCVLLYIGFDLDRLERIAKALEKR